MMFVRFAAWRIFNEHCRQAFAGYIWKFFGYHRLHCFGAGFVCRNWEAKERRGESQDRASKYRKVIIHHNVSLLVFRRSLVVVARGSKNVSNSSSACA
jgi:hypothetical protein